MKPTTKQKEDYFYKIGFFDTLEPSLDVLVQIVEGHSFTFPFETIALHDSGLDHRPNNRTSLNFNQLHRKLVYLGRGGCCVELNLLLQTMLRDIGFTVTSILSDDLFMSSHLAKDKRPKHSAAIVTIDDNLFLIDSAFGGIGLLSPIRLQNGESTQYSERFRIIETKEYPYVLQFYRKDQWISLYGFENKAASLKSNHALEIQNSNTLNKDSLFKTFFACTKPTRMGKHNGRLNLADGVLSVFHNNKKVYKEAIVSQEQMHNILKDHFNIDVKSRFLRFSTVDMLAYQQGIKQPPHQHGYPTRLKEKYERLKSDVKQNEEVLEVPKNHASSSPSPGIR